MRKILIVSLLVFPFIGLSTSSFFLSEYLAQKISANEYNKAQLSFALKQENTEALTLAWNKTPHHSFQWQKIAKILAKSQGNPAYQLAVFHHDNLDKAIFWYKTSIRHEYFKASIALAQLYFQQDKLIEAKDVLEALPKKLSQTLAVDSIVLKTNIALNQGRVNDANEIISNNGRLLQKTESGRLYLAKLKKYEVALNSKQTLKPNLTMDSCENSIQLFATNINHLEHLDNLIIDFKKLSLSEFVCFSSVRYIPISLLDCNDDEGSAISCDERNWKLLATTINKRYVGVMLPRGGANVHFGILYFDAQDTVDVVAHEISHLLGFIDEYPLRAEHVKCQSTQKEVFSHNIAVLKNRYQGEQKLIRSQVLENLAWSKYIKKSTPVLQSVKDISGNRYWQLGTPDNFKHEIGLFNAKTCDESIYKLKGEFSAFKPIVSRTKLEYSELIFPQLYEFLLKDNQKLLRMPSFHYNIALAYFQHPSLDKNNIDQASYWLEKAAEWESELERNTKIRQGEF
jgi:TPR repeat protein